ncbi:MAG: N-6 DNA methylase [Bacteroidota bacterium]
MSKRSYLLNQEIAAFVRDKAHSGLPYTQDDIAFINQYTGYGGMWNYDEHLTKERGLYEYYTPIEIVKAMIGLAYQHGYTGGPVLEPSCGTGRFLHYFSPDTLLTAIELDEISYLIAKVNFPSFDIRHQSFNSLFVDRRGRTQDFKPSYQLIIGNPPYGEFAGRGTQVEKRITKANTYVDYFITRGLDLLYSGGLLIYIVPSAFLDGRPTTVKKQILSKAVLVDAYRLPKAVFEQTDIQTDLVVFKKK